MKYTICSVDRAIELLLPAIKEAKTLGAEFNRPSLLKDVSCRYFMLGTWDAEFNNSLSSDQQMALWIVSDALRDLHINGWMTEGTLIWFPDGEG